MKDSVVQETLAYVHSKYVSNESNKYQNNIFICSNFIIKILYMCYVHLEKTPRILRLHAIRRNYWKSSSNEGA